MLQKQFTFQTQKSETEVYKILNKYFKQNYSYPMQTEKGISFRHFSENKNPISPKRFSKSILVEYQKFSNKNIIKVKIDVGDLWESRLTSIDEEYFKDYFSHIEQMVKTEKIESFDIQKYHEQTKPFVKPFWVVLVIALVLGFVISVFSFKTIGIGFSFALFLAAPAIAIIYVNYKLKKKLTTI